MWWGGRAFSNANASLRTGESNRSTHSGDGSVRYPLVNSVMAETTLRSHAPPPPAGRIMSGGLAWTRNARERKGTQENAREREREGAAMDGQHAAAGGNDMPATIAETAVLLRPA